MQVIFSFNFIVYIYFKWIFFLQSNPQKKYTDVCVHVASKNLGKLLVKRIKNEVINIFILLKKKSNLLQLTQKTPPKNKLTYNN